MLAKTASRSKIVVILALLLAAAGSAPAAVTILDSFTEEFDLSFGGTTAQAVPITSDLVARRQAVGGGFADWTATIAPGSGLMRYTVNLRGINDVNTLLLSYSKPLESIDLLGYSAFQLNVTEVLGSGHLAVNVGGRNPDNSVPLVLTSAGVHLYPFSNIGTGIPVDSVSSIQFWFVPDSTDFSVTVDQIGLIPEPGGGVLAAMSAVLLFRRRRPPKRSKPEQGSRSDRPTIGSAS